MRIYTAAEVLFGMHYGEAVTLDVTAPLPEHMRRSFDMFGFDVKRYDPIENAPE